MNHEALPCLLFYYLKDPICYMLVIKELITFINRYKECKLHFFCSMKFGSIIFNNGDIHPIDDHDLALYNIAEYKVIPNMIVIHFQGKLFNRNIFNG